MHTLGDAHLYSNHLEQADLQLTRDTLAPPQMKINPEVKSIFDFRYDDFELIDYQAHPSIAAPIAVQMIISLIVAMDRQDHSADAYFVNPGYRHSGECQNPVEKRFLLRNRGQTTFSTIVCHYQVVAIDIGLPGQLVNAVVGLKRGLSPFLPIDDTSVHHSHLWFEFW